MKKYFTLAIALLSNIAISASADELPVLKPSNKSQEWVKYTASESAYIERLDKIYCNFQNSFEKGVSPFEQKNMGLPEDDYKFLMSTPYAESLEDSPYDIIGHGDDGWLDAGGGPVDAEATSELKSQGKNDYSPKKAYDGMLNTAWVEGKDDYGIGEKITILLRNDAPLATTVSFYNGYQKTDKSWNNNSRVKKLKMYVNKEPYAILELEDVYNKQIFDLPTKIGQFEKTTRTKDDLFVNDNEEDKYFKSKAVYEVTFEILEVYPGDKYKDTCISEIFFYGEGGYY